MALVILFSADTHGFLTNPWNFIEIKKYRERLKEAGHEVVLVDSGDTIHGNKLVNTVKGANAIALMNLAGYDATINGNHDYLYGVEVLVASNTLLNGKCLSCNLSPKVDGVVSLYNPYMIIKLPRINTQVGVLGISSTQLSGKVPKSYTTLKSKVLYANVNEQVEKMLEEEQNTGYKTTYNIVLAHAASAECKKICSYLHDVDFIFGGHSHKDIAHMAFNNRDGKNGKPIFFAQCGGRMKTLGQIVIDETTISSRILNQKDIEKSLDDLLDPRKASFTQAIDK